MKFSHGDKAAWLRMQPPEYRAWEGMKARCYNPNEPAYSRYGGRGVRVCSRWRRSFKAFLSDMGPRPSARHTIDRWPDNDGNYEPTNCRWATRLQQSEHRPGYNRMVTSRGKSQCVSAWARELGISYSMIHSRLMRGASDEAALLPCTPGYPKW